ncbi:MAG: DUF2130 domain-containing protein, partial [Campylobacterota bacterium]|nr:DUF2130 domain-containing protein [Campylobacterota bacterium]
EFELSDALTQDIEERIRKEHADEVSQLRQKAKEADDLKANHAQILIEARHQIKMQMTEAMGKEKEDLFKQIEALQAGQIQTEESHRTMISEVKAKEREKASADMLKLQERLEALNSSVASAEEDKKLAIEKAAEQAKEQAKEEASQLMAKRIEEAKKEVLSSQQGELTRIQLQLDMAEDNVKQQKGNFQEMLAEQKMQFEEQKRDQKSFFDQQITQQKENLERDVAQRERELVSKTKLESELKLKEQEEMIRKLTDQVDAMQETAQKKSQQLQGEALEVLIEEKLMRDPSFRLDTFSEVKKGANGVDVNMTVKNQMNESCGLVMIEAKRAANWSAGWVEKIKKDRIEAGVKEAVCLIVSTRLRQDEILVDDLGDGVWATVPEYFVHFIQIIRKSMEEMHRVQKSNIDRGDKKEMLYSYVNSDAFRSKVKAMNDYHENIYAQGVKIQRGMKKMLDTIVKSKDMGDDIFIELGNSANVALIPGAEDVTELIDMNSGAHKDKELFE